MYIVLDLWVRRELRRHSHLVLCGFVVVLYLYGWLYLLYIVYGWLYNGSISA